LHFLGSRIAEKKHSFVSLLLPIYNKKNDSWKAPIALWFDHMQKFFQYKSINDMAENIKQLNVPPRLKKKSSLIRTLRRWRQGKQLPSWEYTELIIRCFIKKYKEENDQLIVIDELILEECLVSFGAAKIMNFLHNIFQELISKPNHVIKFNNKKISCIIKIEHNEIIDFYERYYYWHNYHLMSDYHMEKYRENF